jgi:hypothetical protein
MTKQELIDALSELGDDQEIVIADQNGNECTIDLVAIEDTGVLYIDDDRYISTDE